jgi:tripartite-type tricarboxylate transporter receptor subunit TctC
VINRLNQELVRIVKLPDITEQILRTGSDVIANTPEASTATVREDIKKYAVVIKALNIKVE